MPAKTASLLLRLAQAGALARAPTVPHLRRHAAIGQSASPPTTPVAATSAAPSRRPSARRSRRIVKDVLVNNPEILLEAQNALEAKMDKIQAERMAVAIKENAGELFRPTGSPIVGNVKGDVPVIEFFDYNCGYCKKAFMDLASSSTRTRRCA